MGLAGAGDACEAVLEAAPLLAAFDAVSFSSPLCWSGGAIDLRGRPLEIHAGEDDAAARALARRVLAPTEVKRSRLASDGLSEVVNDLAARLLPGLLKALGEHR
ncbi:MAG: hypothetical protein ACK4N5_13465 [Myxococcales bacterium]